MEYYIMTLGECPNIIGPLEWREAVYRQAIVRMSGEKCAIFKKVSVELSLYGTLTANYEMVVDWSGRAIE